MCVRGVGVGVRFSPTSDGRGSGPSGEGRGGGGGGRGGAGEFSPASDGRGPGPEPCHGAPATPPPGLQTPPLPLSPRHPEGTAHSTSHNTSQRSTRHNGQHGKHLHWPFLLATQRELHTARHITRHTPRHVTRHTICHSGNHVTPRDTVVNTSHTTLQWSVSHGGQHGKHLHCPFLLATHREPYTVRHTQRHSVQPVTVVTTSHNTSHFTPHDTVVNTSHNTSQWSTRQTPPLPLSLRTQHVTHHVT